MLDRDLRADLVRSQSDRSGRGKSHARYLPLLLLALIPLWGGCQRDVRISLAELREREERTAAAAPVPVAEDELALTDVRPYVIGVGDVLAVRMKGLLEDRYAETILQVRVHKDGTISMPIVGPVQVAGLDLADAEEAVLAAHVPSVVKDLSVYIELSGPEATTVIVMGAVMTPGLVKLRQNERSLLYALAAAGGFTSLSSGCVRVRPVDAERAETVYRLTDLNDVRRALHSPPLQSGDVLVVEAADSSAVYVSGLVNRPGPILLPADSSLSVVRAVTAAGGLRDYITVRDATLVRSLSDGSQVQVKLALNEILSGRESDVDLRPGDVLMVSHTLETFAQEWVLHNALLGPFQVSLRYDPLAQYNANRAISANRSGNLLSQGIVSSLVSGIPAAVAPQVVNPAQD